MPRPCLSRIAACLTHGLYTTTTSPLRQPTASRSCLGCLHLSSHRQRAVNLTQKPSHVKNGHQWHTTRDVGKNGLGVAVDNTIDILKLAEHLSVDKAFRIPLLGIRGNRRRISDPVLNQVIRR